MKKSEYKRTSNKNVYVQDRLRHKNVFYVSNRWIKWAKRYLNRSIRRKNKYNDVEL